MGDLFLNALLFLIPAVCLVAIGFWQLLRIKPAPPTPSWSDICDERDPVRRSAMQRAIKEANRKFMRNTYIVLTILAVFCLLIACLSPSSTQQNHKKFYPSILGGIQIVR